MIKQNQSGHHQANGAREQCAKADSGMPPVDPWAANEGKAPENLQPGDVFFTWLLNLPSKTNVAVAARKAIQVLEEAKPLSPQALELCGLLREAAHHSSGGNTFVRPSRRRTGKRRLAH